MVVWGGMSLNGFQDHPAVGGRYDPATDSWTPTSVGGGPVGTYDHSAIWTGNQMITWGGSLGVSDTNAGGRYDPIVDAWTPTSKLNAPSAISGHNAVWTGTLMLVWGGFHDGNPPTSQDGGRYDPSTDTWTPISPVNAPFPLDGEVAVWTGSRMIVWGGGVCSGSCITYNFGGVYDPGADRWYSTSMVNAPEPRWFPSAVWTGSQMIVWGGATISGFSSIPLNSGARYDPNTDTWTPIASANLPQVLDQVTAVWTGSRMIVWGVELVNPQLTSGVLYDPGTDTWSPISSTNAPSTGTRHTAIWTGRYMVVWGGNFVGPIGGRYDPATDAWTPTSTMDAPNGRAHHSAVWTGSFMLIWGGGATNSVDPFTDGGRYAVEQSSQIRLTLSQAVLSPANHKMVDIQAIVDAPLVCGATPTVQLISITSSEPDDAPGNNDGHSVDDIQGAEIGTADFAFQLRAELDRSGPGRTYSVRYSATDAGGHTAVASGTVFVPPSGPTRKRVLITTAPAPKGSPKPKPTPKE
jgi:N-acetylneuraminic acid mutarotase